MRYYEGIPIPTIHELPMLDGIHADLFGRWNVLNRKKDAAIEGDYNMDLRKSLDEITADRKMYRKIQTYFRKRVREYDQEDDKLLFDTISKIYIETGNLRDILKSLLNKNTRHMTGVNNDIMSLQDCLKRGLWK